MSFQLAKAVLGAAPVRGLTLLVIRALHAISRIASQARFRALAPHARTLDVRCHWSVEIKYGERISFGQSVIIGPGCTLGAAGGITLGDHVRLSKGAVLETAGLDFLVPPPYPHVAHPITLESGVWVGAGAMVLGGVTVGRNSVVGAGAVVTRDVPPDSIVTGMGTRIRSRLRDGEIATADTRTPASLR